MFKGAFVAVATPFKDGQVDEETLRDLIEFNIENGTAGIVPCGSTGESSTMSHEEHKRVIEVTIDAVKKRVPVIAGAGSNNTTEAIELTKHAKKAGADATLQITPYYNKPTQDGIYEHFKAVAGVGLPFVIYNIQGRTGVNITPQTMARLAEIPEAVAVKEASGNIVQMAEIKKLCGDKLDLLAGDDGVTLPLLALGGVGVISVISNLLPKEMAGLVSAWEAGDVAKAQELYYYLLPICQAMFIETNPIPIKYAMNWAGLIPNHDLRLPLTPMRPENEEKLRAVLTSAGVLK